MTRIDSQNGCVANPRRDTAVAAMVCLVSALAVSMPAAVKLVKWASLDYVVNVKRLPMILDQWQVQHSVLLTAGFDLL
jgi:hypothetical protein